ncbi:MAG TPA: TylF/MycF/NovP-related O-methyltransferase [Parvibaculum sp.]
MLADLKSRLVETYHRRQLTETAQAVREARLTYLSPPKLRNLERYLEQIEVDGIEGDCVEFGVALGGSAILISKLMGPDRSFTGFDLFGTIPPPSARDAEESHARYEVIASGQSAGIGGDRYYGYEDNLHDKVKGHFRAFGLAADGPHVELVKGLFADTVSFDAKKKIAFAHIDCDWYDPVELCLEKTYERLSPGGVVILDDYNDYGGCRVATEAFLQRHGDMQLVDDSYNAVLLRDVS